MRFSAVLEPLFPRTPVVPMALAEHAPQPRVPQPQSDAPAWAAHLAQLDPDQRVRETGEW